MPSHAPPVPYQIDYPSFPPEIRNKIMEFGLVPGDIYPPYSRNGVQLLATSRQNYEDGHVMYYSENVFHIPRGQDPCQLFPRYQPKHLQLIRSVNLSCNFLDLEGGVSDMCAQTASDWVSPKDLWAFLNRKSVATGSVLDETWIMKCFSIQSLFPGLEELRVDLPDVSIWLESMASVSGTYQQGVASACLSCEELRDALDSLKESYFWIRGGVSPLPNGRAELLIFALKECQWASKTLVTAKYEKCHSLKGLRSWFAEQIEEERRKCVASE